MVRLLKSAAVAIVVAVIVCGGSMELSLAVANIRMHRRFAGQGAIGIDVSRAVLLARPQWVILAVTFAVVFVYCYRHLRRRERLPLFLLAGLFCFGIAAVLSVAFMLLVPAPDVPEPRHILLYMGFLLAAYLGTLAFVDGMIAGVWLQLRKPFRSAKRLVGFAALTGCVVGAVSTPVYFSIMNGTFSPRDAMFLAIPGVVVGALLAFFFALAFRRRLLVVQTA